ncbi:putative chitinase [Microsporum canis]
MTNTSSELIPRVIALKKKYPGLQVWAAIGGWSFNDEANSQNTCRAFRNMVGKIENRTKFISALLRFMRTYGFDGADLDWEYLGAEDRGAKTEDTSNLVLLLKEMRTAFQGQYGLSATLPTNFWYLRWFDISKMQHYLDWFSIKTSDIHGVSDAYRKPSGPFVRPHTNLTEIGEGLDLLWRAGVEPSKVTLGLGWYGRSYTLEDVSCSRPGCRFAQGGTPGRCTASPGILSNAEIMEIIDEHNLTPIYDKEAGVNWITWDKTQWVSYDNEITFAQKINYANSLCLGGTMIWAIDFDDLAGTTNSYTIGSRFVKYITGGVSFGGGYDSWSDETIAEVRHSAYVADSCYTSLCGEGCAEGYSAFAYMRGQVDGIRFNTSCADRDTVQSLCCVSGGNPGRCEWHGWRGQGLSCMGMCRDELDVVLAVNSNHFLELRYLGVKEDQTCNGGYQLYCCRGYMPPDNVHTKDVALIANPVVNTYSNLNKRDNRSAIAKCVNLSALVLARDTILGKVTGGLGAVAVPSSNYAVCLTPEGASAGGAVKGGYSVGEFGICSLELCEQVPIATLHVNVREFKPMANSAGLRQWLKRGQCVLKNSGKD